MIYDSTVWRWLHSAIFNAHAYKRSAWCWQKTHIPIQLSLNITSSDRKKAYFTASNNLTVKSPSEKCTSCSYLDKRSMFSVLFWSSFVFHTFRLIQWRFWLQHAKSKLSISLSDVFSKQNWSILQPPLYKPESVPKLDTVILTSLPCHVGPVNNVKLKVRCRRFQVMLVKPKTLSTL